MGKIYEIIQVVSLLLAFHACIKVTVGAEQSEDGDVKLQQLANDMAIIRQKVRQQDHIIEELIQTVSRQGNLIEEQALTIGQLSNTVTKTAVDSTIGKSPIADTRYASEVYGCILDTLSLSCAGDTQISISNAIYGQYYNTCATCCQPSNEDCYELVIDNSPGDWAALKYLCDNKTECSVQYEGAIINECEVGYVADYMFITYDCVGSIIRQGDPIGFTAYAALSRQYQSGEPVLFDNVLTNIGNAYDVTNSSFLCPANGVYMVSVNFQATFDNYMYIELMRDDVLLVEALADDDRSMFAQSSAFVITECSEGQVIWARTGQSGTNVMYSESTGLSHFSAYLLSRY